MEETQTLPEYINFLLAPDTPLDFQINIGDPETTTPVKFNVVKWMLIARSRVFRAMLWESRLKHKEEFNIADMDPPTFKNFLVFLYGYDNTSSLSFEDAVKLLSAADKYEVPELEDRLGEIITTQLTLDNLFVVLRHGLVCEKIPKLWARVTKLIQSHTEDVFSHSDFLTASPEAVVHIVQQDCLSVSEVDVWRAALQWATHRVSRLEGATSPGSLRSTLQPLLQHTRLCTLSETELFREVIPAEVLTKKELAQICVSVSKQEPPDSLPQICNITERRGFVKTFTTRGDASSYKLKESKMYLMTQLSNDVELTGLECVGNSDPELTVPGQTYLCECKVRISRVTGSWNNKSTELLVGFTFRDTVEYNEDFTIPLTVGLKTDTRYVIELVFAVEHPLFYHGRIVSTLLGDDFVMSPTANGPDGYYRGHLKAVYYRVKANR